MVKYMRNGCFWRREKSWREMENREMLSYKEI